MTYLVFHLVFVLPPIVVLAFVQPTPLAGRGGTRARWSLPLVAALALAYTTAWDNYLVASGVWWYGPERVLATIGYVPVEEYAFFLLQPCLTGLWLYYLLGRQRPLTTVAPAPRWKWLGTAAYGVASLAGFAMLMAGTESFTYLGLILAWACPVLAGTWLYGAPVFRSMPGVMATAVAVPTVYLWIADRVAIGAGIWTISDRLSLGWDPLGLPVEEAVFFLVTNLLVVQGILLFLYGDVLAQPRAQATP